MPRTPLAQWVSGTARDMHAATRLDLPFEQVIEEREHRRATRREFLRDAGALGIAPRRLSRNS